jgi:hypothetical protein
MVGLLGFGAGFAMPLSSRTAWKQQLEFSRRNRAPSRLYYGSESPESNLTFASSSSNSTVSTPEDTDDKNRILKSSSFSKDAVNERHQSTKREDKLLLPNSYKAPSKPINATFLSVDSSHDFDEAPEPLRHQGRLRKRVKRWTHNLNTQWNLFWKSQRNIKPGMKFRLRITVAIIAMASVLSFFLPATRVAGGAKGLKSVFTIVTRWLASRGFQGIAALGRSVAYGWALFVGYPRLLDRRAKEKKKREREKALERWRVYLRSLAAEVVRLRQELSSIDSEIRTFRREIISLKASLTKNEGVDTKRDDCDSRKSSTNNSAQWNDDIQEAITQEMTHLRQLRDDTKQALAAARETWSEMRAKSPLEAWEADDFLLLSSPDSYSMLPLL